MAARTKKTEPVDEPTPVDEQAPEEEAPEAAAAGEEQVDAPAADDPAPAEDELEEDEAPRTAPVGSTVRVPAGAIVRWPDGTTMTTHGYVLLTAPGEYWLNGEVLVTAETGE